MTKWPIYALAIVCLLPPVTIAQESAYPKYKPSSRSPIAIDIRSNEYGGSKSAPNALEIADVVPDFKLAKSYGGEVSLVDLRSKGPVALIFYRGHW